MKTLTIWILKLAIAVTLTVACSIELSDVTPAVTLPPPTATLPLRLTPTATVTAPPPSATPLPWAEYSVSGQLLYTQGAQGIYSLDLANGEQSPLFAPPENAWLTAATLSPDGGTLALAYAPPPPDGQIQFGYTGLYILKAGSDQPPVELISRSNDQEAYFSPAWSPDGNYIYFAHFIPVKSESGNTFEYSVGRIAYPDGEPETLVSDAIWPRLSPDGATLAYLSFDTQTFANYLYLANPDGTDPRPLFPPETFPSVDAHFFSPDGSQVYFSAIGQSPSPALSWFNWLSGVRVASAHNVPSDWWRVPAEGGMPERLTKIFETGLYGSFSADGEHIAFIGAGGLYLMNADGDNLRPIYPVSTLGTLEWIP